MYVCAPVLNAIKFLIRIKQYNGVRNRDISFVETFVILFALNFNHREFCL